MNFLLSASLLFLSIVQAIQATKNNCFGCAKEKTSYMCYKKDMFQDPWEVACCKGDSKAPNCDRSDATLTCSPTYADAGFAFYTFCPNIKPEECGIKQHEGNFVAQFSSNKLSLETNEEVKKFEISTIRYKGVDREWKAPAFDVCYYEITPPSWLFINGETTITINSVEPGIDLYLTAGSSITQMSQSFTNQNETVKAGDTFKISMPNNFFLTAVPKQSSFNTSFSI
jgi:hypothetical protein